MKEIQNLHIKTKMVNILKDYSCFSFCLRSFKVLLLDIQKGLRAKLLALASLELLHAYQNLIKIRFICD